jgi:hypothetical protein
MEQKSKIYVHTLPGEVSITLNRTGLRDLLSCLAQVASGQPSSSCITFPGENRVNLEITMSNEGDLA